MLLLLGMNLMLIGAGLFLDAISIFYIFLPVLLPVAAAIGIDPVHFGVVITVNLAIGQITPPVGINLVTASGISGLGIGAISRASLPFIAAEIAALLVITYVPALSLWIPALVSGHP
ncbi:MAG: TRAP transporter large permease subunit [Armatimonadia bacterium]|nr:TRAP transporter large permease subunit [Armatimonadia bacterium]